VQRAGVSAFTLNGSAVRIAREHVVLDVSGDRVRLEWQDRDGVTIHWTTYTDPPVEEEEEEEEEDEDEQCPCGRSHTRAEHGYAGE
jgi:hypothetical protein